MGLLKEIGIDLDGLELSIAEDKATLTDLESQGRQAAEKAWGKYWPGRVRQVAEESGIYPLMARTVVQAAQILGLEQMPRLGLLNGLEVGMVNYQGYCWEENGEVWVGPDEMWFDSVLEGGADYFSQRRIREVLAEEVFHAYVRQVRPDLAEENMKLDPADREAYGKSPVEQAAKEFASWYAAVSN